MLTGLSKTLWSEAIEDMLAMLLLLSMFDAIIIVDLRQE